MEESNKSLEKPWLFKKGNPGGPGRPKGKTMKEWAKDYLASLPDEERFEFLEGLPKDVVWKMAEGNPATNTDITSGGKPIPIYGGQSITIQEHNSDQEDIPTE